MLILTRRISETIRIDHEIKITVLGVKGSQVRMGIAAPPDVAVHREEIYKRIRAEQGEGLAESAPCEAQHQPKSLLRCELERSIRTGAS